MSTKPGYKHIYITFGLNEYINEVVKKYRWTKKYFTYKAIELFLSGKKDIDPYILITKRSDINYIKRDVMFQVCIEDAQFETILEVAKKYNCKYSVVIFQALYDYSLFLESVK